MPYREKGAWLYLLAMAVTYGPYFVWAYSLPRSSDALASIGPLKGYALAAVAQMLILAVGFAVLRRRTPADERGPADERDRAIELRSTRVAYYVLMTGMLVVGVVMPFTDSGWAIVNAALAWTVLALVVQNVVAVWSYRRDLA